MQVELSVCTGQTEHNTCSVRSQDITLSGPHSVSPENKDYEKLEEIVRFDSSSSETRDLACVTVRVIRDDILEDTESFIMEIEKVDSSQGYEIRPNHLLVEIQDRNSESSLTHILTAFMFVIGSSCRYLRSPHVVILYCILHVHVYSW